MSLRKSFEELKEKVEGKGAKIIWNDEELEAERVFSDFANIAKRGEDVYEVLGLIQFVLDMKLKSISLDEVNEKRQPQVVTWNGVEYDTNEANEKIGGILDDLQNDIEKQHVVAGWNRIERLLSVHPQCDDFFDENKDNISPSNQEEYQRVASAKLNELQTFYKELGKNILKLTLQDVNQLRNDFREVLFKN